MPVSDTSAWKFTSQKHLTSHMHQVYTVSIKRTHFALAHNFDNMSTNFHSFRQTYITNPPNAFYVIALPCKTYVTGISRHNSWLTTASYISQQVSRIHCVSIKKTHFVFTHNFDTSSSNFHSFFCTKFANSLHITNPPDALCVIALPCKTLNRNFSHIFIVKNITISFRQYLCQFSKFRNICKNHT